MSLNLISVNKSFGIKHVVENLNLSIPKGEVFGFLGSNGAGKTTTMRMILDIIRPDSGQITWQDKPVGLETARSFGYLPEERGLYPKMIVADQMNFFARLRGLSKVEAEKRIDYWSERFQLGELVKKKANELSKGNQQKIQFIIAILHQPDLLILDEPFSGLDPVNVELLKTAFRDLAKEGRTILFSSHRMEHIEELCDSLCIIKEGRLIAKGSVGHIKGLTGRQIIRLSIVGSLDFLEDFQLELSTLGSNINKQSEGLTQTTKEVEFDIPKGIDPQAILQRAIEHGEVKRFEIGDPTLNEVFITLVGGNV
ncbi:ATP-binding cassette domain-containing protein [Desulfosporosinus sp. Sb-LF]|uniref:ABC transporter ATP-binding protein n=1 Tax=Desulfosporosinus sp. Sb-LF TaxID=2560027 RepID=UPI00107F5B8D|nr:ATP-binding cassette domain-containing protein [Desulfosporosinus sp. Sb-LF]TGE31403.1 ATP-binding cassette domain-containing protein [Desulfosporosinus sp. Sb-LF]